MNALLLICALALSTFSFQKSSASYELKARFTTNVIFSSLPIGDIEKMMSQELGNSYSGEKLKLDPSAQEITSQFYEIPKNHYPVVILQGIQDSMTNPKDEIFVHNGRPLISYNEMIFLIPHVQLKGKNYSYLKRLYLDKALPVVVGKTKHGYDKVLADFMIQTSDGTESVKVSSNSKVVGTFQANTLLAQSQMDFTGLMKALLPKDYISILSSNGVEELICTEQPIELVKNSLYPIQAQATLEPEFFNSGDLSRTLTFDGSKTSVRMIYNWSLPAPQRCLQ